MDVDLICERKVVAFDVGHVLELTARLPLSPPGVLLMRDPRAERLRSGKW